MRNDLLLQHVPGHRVSPCLSIQILLLSSVPLSKSGTGNKLRWFANHLSFYRLNFRHHSVTSWWTRWKLIVTNTTCVPEVCTMTPFLIISKSVFLRNFRHGACFLTTWTEVLFLFKFSSSFRPSFDPMTPINLGYTPHSAGDSVRHPHLSHNKLGPEQHTPQNSRTFFRSALPLTNLSSYPLPSP
jgi:hypothetical protein